MIRPLQNRIVVKPIRSDDVLESGLWVPRETTSFSYRNPNSPEEAITKGQVLALGKKTDPQGAKVGDVVHFSDSCGRPFVINDMPVMFIREDDIAYIEGD